LPGTNKMFFNLMQTLHQHVQQFAIQHPNIARLLFPALVEQQSSFFSEQVEPHVYTFHKVLMIVSGGILGGLVGTLVSSTAFSSFILGPLIGISLLFLIPDFLLKEQQKILQHVCVQSLPEFFDQLSLSVEHFATIREAIEHLPTSLPEPFAHLLKRFVRQNQFSDSASFFTNLSTSFHHPLVSEFATLATTHQKTGGSVEHKIRELSNQAHQEIILNAKKSGNVTSGILLGPLLIFHVPALIILLMIPMIISFTKSL
jgi:pilus assembly protein TadC